MPKGAVQPWASETIDWIDSAQEQTPSDVEGRDKRKNAKVVCSISKQER